ncbi:hypothetical protein [Gemmata obscuriglobus]|uniref:hypothetical protein n=1 Tax=Gemmata obscuriglobus TaxID=114 RepID=UPI0002EEA9E4|nr:hypothetical protein [Gemmata obscuriglobus]
MRQCAPLDHLKTRPREKKLADDLRENFGADVRPPLVRGFLMDLRGSAEPRFDLPTSREKAKNTRSTADDKHST